MKHKNIKKSQRGLTFSFLSKGQLAIGYRFDYIIDKADKKIKIMPAKNGRYKISRKRNGTRWDSLIDLRNKEVLAAIAAMDSIRISISDGMIVVSDASAVAKRSSIVLALPRRALHKLRMAAGMESFAAVDQLLSGTQISLD